jgi:hypothetical protein
LPIRRLSLVGLREALLVRGFCAVDMSLNERHPGADLS